MSERNHTLARAALSSFLATALLALPGVALAQEVPEEWRTVAEASDFTATSSYQETVLFLRTLTHVCPFMELRFIGRSAEGRPLPLLVVDKGRQFTPEAARKFRQPIILIVSCIHAGEVDGKDASLMLLRDLALGRRGHLLDAGVLLFIPIFNADGHERVSLHNRPNQDGPKAGMGFRTTASGLDLNRDHMKLGSPEMRALVKLFCAWRPHLHVDNHVTDGSDHNWVLTWGRAEAPQLAASLDGWMEKNMPGVIAETRSAGHAVGPYVDLLDPLDPSKGVSSVVGGARYSTGYFPLRNRPSILIETHSYKPFKQRVLANLDFLAALIAKVGERPQSLVGVVNEAEQATTALGRPDAAPSTVVLRWRDADPSESLRFPVYDWFVEPSVVTGRPLLRYRRGHLHPVTAPWQHRVVPDLEVARPRGYLVLPGWPQIEARLEAHGLEVLRLTKPARLEVETMRATDPEFDQHSFQGQVRVSAQIARQAETRSLPAGTLWVPAAQPDFEVAVQLLEPEAPDSLLQWGLLSSVFEPKEYIDPRVLEGLAVEMLKDPKLQAEWTKALEDQELAADPQRRHRWWYQRTPYWDQDIGLLPILRLMKPAELATAPLSPEP